MRFLEKWLSASDDEKVAIDRRAFLRGMTVTGAGLLVPAASVFDMGVHRPAPVSLSRCVLRMGGARGPIHRMFRVGQVLEVGVGSGDFYEVHSVRPSNVGLTPVRPEHCTDEDGTVDRDVIRLPLGVNWFQVQP